MLPSLHCAGVSQQHRNSFSFSEQHVEEIAYLVSEGEGLLLAEIEVLGVVVDDLRLREPSSLHCISNTKQKMIVRNQANYPRTYYRVVCK